LTDLFIIEIAVIIAIICIQLYIFFSIIIRIGKFKSVFDVSEPTIYDVPTDCSDGTKIPQLKSKQSDQAFRKIILNLNNYIKNNYRFGIKLSALEDIIQREVYLRDEEITQSIPSPLYIGLIGTLIGILFGLYSLYQELDLSMTQSFNLNDFFRAVGIAVLASFFGLLFSTILSYSIYKPAFKLVNRGKNRLLTFLQNEYLPKIYKYNRDGFEGIKNSLDAHAHTLSFNIGKLVEASNNNLKSLEKQDYIIKRIEKIDVKQISSANLRIFEKLEANLSALERFSENLSSMERISENLENFASRTTHIDVALKQVTENIQFSNDLTRVLNAHMIEIEGSKNYAKDFIESSNQDIMESVNLCKDALKNFLVDSMHQVKMSLESLKSSVNESIGTIRLDINKSTEDLLSDTKNTNIKLKEDFSEFQNQINETGILFNADAKEKMNCFKESVSEFDTFLEKKYIQLKKSVEELTQHSKEEFSQFCSDESSQIQKLNYLKELPEIKDRVQKSTDMTISSFSYKINGILSVLNTLNSKIEYFSKISSDLNSGKINTEKKPTSASVAKKKTLLRLIPFRRKKK